MLRKAFFSFWEVIRWRCDGAYETPITVAKVSNESLASYIQFIFMFGLIRSSEGVVRAFVNMDYVASDELGNLVRLGIVLEMYFTYAVQ